MIRYINELRNRFILLLLCWLGVFVISYFYKEIVLFEILKPTVNSDTILNYFIFTSVTELFNVYIKLSIFLSNQIVTIYTIYNFLDFIIPGLYYKEYKLLKFIFQLIVCFWLLSLVFFTFYFAPFIWNFFLSFQNNLSYHWIDIQFEAKISDYFEFFTKSYYSCNLQFQIFVGLILFLICFSKNKTSIKTFKKQFYFLFLLIATLLTPPDLFSQILVFAGLVLFFEFIILIRLMLNKLQY